MFGWPYQYYLQILVICEVYAVWGNFLHWFCLEILTWVQSAVAWFLYQVSEFRCLPAVWWNWMPFNLDLKVPLCVQLGGRDIFSILRHKGIISRLGKTIHSVSVHTQCCGHLSDLSSNLATTEVHTQTLITTTVLHWRSIVLSLPSPFCCHLYTM